MAIQSFLDKDVEQFFVNGRISKNIGWASVRKVVKRKLDMLHYAARLNDLRVPPGNRLEALEGDLEGLHSIRINDQWRVIFRWSDVGPWDVYIDDYH